MTISTQETKISYDGNGVTTEFAFPYRFLSNSHIVVIRVAANGVGTTLVLNTDYTLTGAGDDAGGTVTLNIAPAADQRLVIYRQVPMTQETDYVSGDSFPAETHEEALDKLTMITQQHSEALSRAVTLSIISEVEPSDFIDSILQSVVDAETAADRAEAAVEAFGEGGILAVEFGGTNADTAAGARTNLGAQESLVSGANIKTLNGESLLGSGNLVIDTSSLFDQLALTNLRLLLNTGVTTGALAQGRQWELATDEWAASSTSEVYVNGSPSYYTNAQTTQPSTSGLTKIGDMTSGVGGGLAAAFDGNENQTETTSARKESATVAYVGVDWGSGNTKKISGFWIKGSTDQGFVANINPTVTVTLQGSTDNFASSVVDIGTASGTDANSLILQNLAIDTSTAYRYHRAKIEHNGAANAMLCAELKLYEFAVTDVTLIPPASVSVATAPAYISAFMLYKDDDGSAVLGTDLTVEVSRDGGTTYTAATITTVASYDGTYSAIKARADVSAQPSGTSLLMRVKTLNSKAQRIAAPAIYAE